MSISAARLLQDDEHEIKSEKQIKPTSENPEDSHPTAMFDEVAEPHQRIAGKFHQEDNAIDRGLTSEKEFEGQSQEEEEEVKFEDSDEGFRTPTSYDFKIPIIQNCPPAPRKPKTLRNDSERNMPVFLSDDVARWMISSSILLELHHKIKKSRKLKADQEVTKTRCS